MLILGYGSRFIWFLIRLIRMLLLSINQLNLMVEKLLDSLEIGINLLFWEDRLVMELLLKIVL
jgi:hypothetical protein